jgi:hypothetical protein
MLIGTLLYKVLFYGSIALAVIGVLIVKAKAYGHRAWIPGAMILAGAVAAFGLHTHWSGYAVIVTGDGPNLTTEWKRAPEHPSGDPIAQSNDMYSPDEATWVINRSSRTVRVEDVAYGSFGLGGGDPTVIPPGKMARFYHIDDIGPGNPPPSSISVDSKLPMAFRSWLTWDDE